MRREVGGAPVDRCKPGSAGLMPRGLAFVGVYPSHQVSTSGVVPYLSLLSAVLGTELALSKRLLNE